MTKIIAGAAVVTVLATYAILDWRSQSHVTRAGFWFETSVTFDLPHLRAADMAPLTDEEKQTIESIAWSEIRAAFAGLRIRFVDDRGAIYSVRVVQEYPAGFGGPGAAGQSRVLALLGGNGSVSFLMLGTLAISHAPQDADRATIVQGIGTGIGRGAVHEFAHQILPRVGLHDSKATDSYEYGYAARPAQYYGPMRWDIAWPTLVGRLGPVDRARTETSNQLPE